MLQSSGLSSKLVSLTVILGVALAVSACGRRGSLDPVIPGDTVAQENKVVELEGEKPESTVDGKSFVLDPLI
ncbi:hypothetical protein E1162_14415 [Rhodobacteraceae bacterium RKSG542]|uniref:lipoprotein n=1 Tax=Pseudovibrio flavus TaxID=2529854 RepID=UPI0012BBBCCF|nr:lipoprotein [Pseudovibrio flavus]MTI18434.1 hypothetical protein [Pseudovibrio flavus]